MDFTISVKLYITYDFNDGYKYQHEIYSNNRNILVKTYEEVSKNMKEFASETVAKFIDENPEFSRNHVMTKVSATQY